jgi:hypothetical protein
MTTMQSSNPLTAWWWRSKDNYGDILTPYVLSYASGRDVAWASAMDAEMISIGSVMQVVNKRVTETQNPVYVWGSGMMEPVPMDIAHMAAISLVRGPLTATRLNMDDLPQGDPGLLADEALEISTTVKSHQYGIVPHWTHNDTAGVDELMQALPNAKLINMITQDAIQTTQDIANCEVILSSSLHGLIVADSLGVPNIWIDTGRIAQNTRFKFFDYALSVGRAMAAPYNIKTLLASGIPEVNVSYFANLPAIKDTIKNAFPSELKAC